MALINCPECNKSISDTSDKCPHCGFPLTAEIINDAKIKQEEKEKAQGKKGLGCLALIALIVFGIYLYESPSEEGQKSAFTVEHIKKLTGSETVGLHQQTGANKNTYLVELTFNQSIVFSVAQAWNSVAGRVHYVSKKLLARPETVRIHFIFRSPENNNSDWAHVWVKRTTLPNNWENATYLEFFSLADMVNGGTVDVNQGLCEFYLKYESARPHGKLPASCR